MQALPSPLALKAPRPRPRRTLRGLAIGLLGFLAAILAAYPLFLRSTALLPPAPEPRWELPLEVRGERSYVGTNWLTRERGVWEYHLEGDPYAMGFAHIRLGNRLLQEADDYMFSEMERYVPSPLARFALVTGVRFRYRHLLDHVPLDRQREIAAQARAFVDHHADFLPTFHRMVFYHALHDITQGVEHSPLLGCTAFAMAGAATANGHLIIGRNFDFEGPEPFDREKAVLFFKPEGKIPFVSVAWTGMAGVVTGMNLDRLFVSLNAARTDDKGGEGIPVELLVRELLENARSIDEAVALVRRYPVMVSDFYLVADGKTGESAVIERSPTRLEVRRSRDTSVLTNHALTPAFARDAENDRLRRYLTSGARFRRLAELVRQARGTLDPERALQILRDKRAEGGAPLGLGHRSALDALIATHSVIADATSLRLWVSSGPHCSGRYVGFDLEKELGGAARAERADPPPLPEDPVLGSEEFRLHRQAVAELAAARRAAHDGRPERAVEQALKAISLDERMPEPHRLLGDLLRTTNPERARQEYQRFLDLRPPYLHDVEAVKGILSSL